MPRGQATAKRQQGGANQRDTRHENGLVGPGKRVQKQKSNGHLNGHTKPAESNSAAPALPPLPSLPASPASPYPEANGHARQTQAHPADAHSSAAAADPNMSMSNGNVRRPSASTYSESSSSESYQNTSGVSAENHRRIDVNATKNPAVHRDVGPLNLALTVLRSCPLYDTIAILIVLLQLPPTFLSLIHLLFATLTFVPPSSSTTTGLSFTDIFEGTMGTPSVATILVVDLFVLMTWLFLWNPAQDIALDLAQTVIAFTLGGGTNGRDAGLKNIFVCFSIVGISHFTRNGNVKHSGLRAILSSSNRILGSPDPDDPLEQTPYHGGKKGAHGWIRSILAMHILAQGLVRYVRDWYVRRNLREKRDTSVSTNDPEAGKALADAGSDPSVPTSPSQENDPASALPVTSTANSKKKKKQSAQVRIRQPLWAALASTKIVVVKEYETSHTAAESAGTNATDINNLGNAPFNTEADRIWITYVGTDEVLFSTSYFPTYTTSESVEGKDMDPSRVDKSKPFYVRVNRTVWQPTRIHATVDPDQPARQDTTWGGEVFGLAPASNYECEFVSTVDRAVIFSTNVRTLQAPTADAAVGPSPNPRVSGRPGSPTTTLKTSIASSEVKLTEERNRQKRERKDQRAKLHSIRKEIDKLANSIASSGSNDDRIKQKIQQNHLHMKQAEDALVALADETRSLEALPKDDASLYLSSKSEFQTQKEQHKQFRSEFNSAKQTAERDISALNSETSSLQQKRERMQSRIAKLNGEHERITDANAKGLDEAQRKERERQAKETERAKIEIIYSDRLAVLNAQVLETTAALQVMYRNIDTMQQAEIYASASPTSSVPNLNASSTFGTDMATEAHATASYPWNPTMPATTGAYIPGTYATQPHTQLQGDRTRGRSSSMLSNLSGFTQSDGEGEGPVPLYPPSIGKTVWYDAEKERHGSSGSGSGPASMGDPKSPIV